MQVLLTHTATMQKTRNGFSVTMIHKKGCDKLLKLSFQGKVILIDARYENFCFIRFEDKEGQHVLAITDYEEPLLDGELMFI
jgi:hypothetical protein